MHLWSPGLSAGILKSNADSKGLCTHEGEKKKTFHRAEGEGGMNSESSINIYILPCVKETASGKLLYITQGAQPVRSDNQGIFHLGLVWLKYALNQTLFNKELKNIW